MATQGLWNVGGVNIPDLGLNENLYKYTGIQVGPLNSGVTAPNWDTSVKDQTGEQYLKDQVQKTGATINYTKGQYGPTNVTYAQPDKTTNTTTNNTNSGGYSGPTNEQITALGLAPGDVGGYERVLREQEAARAARENAIRSGIESAYGGIRNRINTFQQNLPTWRTEDLNTLGQSVSSMKNQLGTAKQAGIDTVNSFRGDVANREKLGIERIQDNLRNLLRTTGMQLGAMGAGSSSASEVIAPFALQKQATRGFGDVTRQSNEQYSALDREEINLGKEFDLQTQQVDQWEAEQKQSIVDKIRGFEQAIIDAQNTNDQARLSALTSLEAGLMNQAQAKIDQIETMAMQERQGLQEWARNRMAQLNDMKLKLNPNFTPQNIVAQELQGIGGMTGGGDSGMFYNPAVFRKREDQL